MSIEVGTLILVEDYRGWHRGVITESFDNIFMAKCMNDSYYFTGKFNYTDEGKSFQILKRDGVPLKAKKNWYGAYKLREA